MTSSIKELIKNRKSVRTFNNIAISDLPMEEKKKILKQAIMDGIQLNPDMPDMDEDKRKAIVDDVFDLLAGT